MPPRKKAAPRGNKIAQSRQSREARPRQDSSTTPITTPAAPSSTIGGGRSPRIRMAEVMANTGAVEAKVEEIVGPSSRLPSKASIREMPGVKTPIMANQATNSLSDERFQVIPGRKKGSISQYIAAVVPMEYKAPVRASAWRRPNCTTRDEMPNRKAVISAITMG